jgi:hypothetical protein
VTAPLCTATNRHGEPCRNHPIRGGTVCRAHGGATPQARAAANRRLAEQKEARALRRGLAAAYGENVPHIDHRDAMLRAVSWKYAEVLALRAKVAELDDADHIWGRTREKTGGEDYGTTEEAKPHIWWTMLRQAEEQLVKFAAAASAAGCEERRIALAEQQGDMLAGALRTILDTLLAALLAAGMADTLRTVWTEQVAQIVPRELRRLADH